MNAKNRSAKRTRERSSIRHGIVPTFTEIRRQEYGTDVHHNLVFVLRSWVFDSFPPFCKDQRSKAKTRSVVGFYTQKDLFDTPSTLDYASIVLTNVYGPAEVIDDDWG